MKLQTQLGNTNLVALYDQNPKDVTQIAENKNIFFCYFPKLKESLGIIYSFVHNYSFLNTA